MKTKTFFGLMAFVCLAVLNFTEGANNFGLGQALASTSSSSSSSRGSSSSSSSSEITDRMVSEYTVKLECTRTKKDQSTKKNTTTEKENEKDEVNADIKIKAGPFEFETGGKGGDEQSKENGEQLESQVNDEITEKAIFEAKNYTCAPKPGGIDKCHDNFIATCETPYPDYFKYYTL